MEREVAVGAAAVSTYKIGRNFVGRSLRILSYTTVLSNWIIIEIIDPVLRMKYAHVGGRGGSTLRSKNPNFLMFLNKKAVCRNIK